MSNARPSVRAGRQSRHASNMHHSEINPAFEPDSPARQFANPAFHQTHQTIPENGLYLDQNNRARVAREVDFDDQSHLIGFEETDNELSLSFHPSPIRLL